MRLCRVMKNHQERKKQLEVIQIYLSFHAFMLSNDSESQRYYEIIKCKRGWDRHKKVWDIQQVSNHPAILSTYPETLAG